MTRKKVPASRVTVAYLTRLSLTPFFGIIRGNPFDMGSPRWVTERVKTVDPMFESTAYMGKSGTMEPWQDQRFASLAAATRAARAMWKKHGSDGTFFIVKRYRIDPWHLCERDYGRCAVRYETMDAARRIYHRYTDRSPAKGQGVVFAHAWEWA